MAALVQHACFSCRKVFKKPRRPLGSAHACPQCSAALRNMGQKFRAPRIDDVAEWKRIERCLAEGISYGTPTRRKPSRKQPGAPEITPALKKALGFNAKWKRPRKRR